MSRFDWSDNDYSEARANLWEANVRRALGGKRGQAALRELEAALLALPQPRLTTGTWSDGQDVCALGAMDLRRRVAGGQDIHDALDEMRYWDAEDADGSSRLAMRRLKMTYTLAYEIAQQNDEWHEHATPEQRWAAMLDWVRIQIMVAEGVN